MPKPKRKTSQESVKSDTEKSSEAPGQSATASKTNKVTISIPEGDKPVSKDTMAVIQEVDEVNIEMGEEATSMVK